MSFKLTSDRDSSVCLNPSELHKPVDITAEEQGATAINSDTSNTFGLQDFSHSVKEEDSDPNLLSPTSTEDKDDSKISLKVLNKSNLRIMDTISMNKDGDVNEQDDAKKASNNDLKHTYSNNSSIGSSDRSSSLLQMQEPSGKFNLYNNSNFFNGDSSGMYNRQNHFSPSQSSNLTMGDLSRPSMTEQVNMDFSASNNSQPLQLLNTMGMTPNFNNSPFTPNYNAMPVSPFGNLQPNPAANNNPTDNQKVVHVPVPVAVPVFMAYNSRPGNTPNETNNMYHNIQQMNHLNSLNNNRSLSKQQMDYLLSQQQMLQFQNMAMSSSNFFFYNKQNLENGNDGRPANLVNQMPLQLNNVYPPIYNSNMAPKQEKSKKKPHKNSKKSNPSVTTLTITKESSGEPESNPTSNSISSNSSLPMERLKILKENTTTPASDISSNTQVKTPIETHNLLSELAIESLQRQRNQGKLIHLDPVPQFKDQKDVKLWLQKIFYPLGIEIAIERSDKSKISFKCKALKKADEELHLDHDHTHGNTNSDDLLNDEAKKRRIKSPFNTCPFRIRASYKSKSEKWQIVIVNNSHSHQLKFTPTSIYYKQFKQQLRDMNDLETVKKFDELEYKTKMNLPMEIDRIPCDCGLTEEVQSFGVVLPTSFTSGKQQNSALAKFTQKNTIKRSNGAGKYSDESDAISNSSGVTKVKKQSNKNNKVLDNLRKHVNISSGFSVESNTDNSVDQCLNTDGGLMDFSEQLSKVDFFLAGQKPSNIAEMLKMGTSKDASTENEQAQVQDMNAGNGNNFFDFNMGVDEVDFTELFLKPHKKEAMPHLDTDQLDSILPQADPLLLENIDMPYSNSEENENEKNEELAKDLNGMHLFENSKSDSFFF